MAIKQKDLDALPAVSGERFSLLAAALRDYSLAVQDTPENVVETLIDLLGWDGEDAEWVASVLEDGVAAISDGATDPRAEQFRKDTTVVRRKRS
jgi:hypothetical protein